MNDGVEHGRPIRAGIPAETLERGLALAQDLRYFGVKLAEMTQAEAIATAAFALYGLGSLRGEVMSSEKTP